MSSNGGGYNDPPTGQIFFHSATRRWYRWSESQRIYIFEDGTRVAGPRPPPAASFQQISPLSSTNQSRILQPHLPSVPPSYITGSPLDLSSASPYYQSQARQQPYPPYAGQSPYFPPPTSPGRSHQSFNLPTAQMQSLALSGPPKDAHPNARPLKDLLEHLITSRDPVPYLGIPEDPVDQGRTKKNLRSLTPDQRRFMMWYLMSLALLAHKSFRGTDTQRSIEIVIDILDKIGARESSELVSQQLGQNARLVEDIKIALGNMQRYMQQAMRTRESVNDLVMIARELTNEHRSTIVETLDRALGDTQASSQPSRSTTASRGTPIPRPDQSLISQTHQDAFRRLWRSSRPELAKGDDSSRKSGEDSRMDQILMNPVILLSFMYRQIGQQDPSEEDSRRRGDEQQPSIAGSSSRPSYASVQGRRSSSTSSEEAARKAAADRYSAQARPIQPNTRAAATRSTILSSRWGSDSEEGDDDFEEGNDDFEEEDDSE